MTNTGRPKLRTIPRRPWERDEDPTELAIRLAYITPARARAVRLEHEQRRAAVGLDPGVVFDPPQPVLERTASACSRASCDLEADELCYLPARICGRA